MTKPVTVHEFRYSFTIGSDFVSHIFGCKNCKFVFSKINPISETYEEHIKSIKDIQKNYPEAEDIKPLTKEEWEMNKKSKENYYGLESVEILAYPAEFHVIGYEPCPGGVWYSESGYFSVTGEFISSCHQSRCLNCCYYEERDATCSNLLLPYDPEIQLNCPEYRYAPKFQLSAENLIDSIIKKS